MIWVYPDLRGVSAAVARIYDGRRGCFADRRHVSAEPGGIPPLCSSGLTSTRRSEQSELIGRPEVLSVTAQAVDASWSYPLKHPLKISESPRPIQKSGSRSDLE